MQIVQDAHSDEGYPAEKVCHYDERDFPLQRVVSVSELRVSCGLEVYSFTVGCRVQGFYNENCLCTTYFKWKCIVYMKNEDRMLYFTYLLIDFWKMI